jgi:hypothetical protein
MLLLKEFKIFKSSALKSISPGTVFLQFFSRKENVL